ncbi:hypothetical protein HAX54_023735 [Datura stramonium]|uniref:Uncharacterized protein n=1 Tax=Datura stramonium TaxID=4076 RepID=A0ABS8UWU1_DATST|nr:hypothetical protein [Datura stramonium]
MDGSFYHTKEIMCATRADKDEVAEDNLVEGLKNLFIAEEEAECNVILKDCAETPTIWDDEPGDALNNWTCTPSPVLRESW